MRQKLTRFAVYCYEQKTNPGLLCPVRPKTIPGLLCPPMGPKQTQVCYVLLRAQNKPRLDVSSYDPKTNSGSLCPAMSQKQTRFAVSCYEPKTNRVLL